MISGIIKVVEVLSATADTYRGLDYSGYHKTECNNVFIIQCFKENNDKRIVEEATQRADFAVCKMPLTTPELEIALGNHALIPIINCTCRLLANEKKPIDYNL